jgi:general secretion pathway protein C
MKTALFTAVHLLLLALASYFGVGLFYQVMSADLELAISPAAPVQASPAPAAAVALQPLDAYRTIAERNLFRTADPNAARKPTPEVVDLAALKETQLDLKLWGTLVLDDGRGSYAVIEDRKAGGQNLYRVGDRVQEASVKMILRERVVLDVAGKDEILQIEELSGAVAGAGAPARPSPAAAQAPGGTAAGGLAEAAGDSQAAESEPASRDVTLNRQTLEEAMGNVGELMKQVRIRPFFEGGKPSGLSLAGVAPGSIFEQMGIRNGDVIQAVDGQPIQTVDDVVSLYQSLSSAQNLAIQVRRGGQVQDIQYKIE